MVYIRKITRNQDRALDIIHKAQEDAKPKPPPRDMNLYHMQQIVNKMKRGEKL